MRVWVARALVLSILAVAAYGYWQGTPEDVVYAVRRGQVEQLRRALKRDPANVHTKSYAQAYETQSARTDYRNRTGDDPWGGRYLVHDAVEIAANGPAILDVLKDGGADFTVRLNGKTLLHLAAAKGDLEVAAWLLDHGADVHAVIDCADACADRGYTPLHSGMAFRDDQMTELLLSRGARMETTGSDGRTAMHVAAARGLGGAFVLARHGANLTPVDAAGKTPFDLAGVRAPGAEIADADLARHKLWFTPTGPLATISEMVRTRGTPMSDETARELVDTLESTPR